MTDEARRRLEKAERAIRATEVLMGAGHWDFAAGRVYYAMFYVAEALLSTRGPRFTKHGAVHAAYGQHFARTRVLDPKYHRWLLNSFDVRSEADYGQETDITQSQVETMLVRAREFLAAARAHLKNPPPAEP